MIRRRTFIAGLGSAAACPVVAWAQQPTMPVVGFLSTTTRDRSEDALRQFHRGLSEAGFTEGGNVSVEYRWAENHEERLAALAVELVARRVNVIAAVGGLPSALAAKAATMTIPVVFTTGVDPVAFGLVSSFNRPGGNVTGVSSWSNELGPKKLELLHDTVPTAKIIGSLFPRSPPDTVQVTMGEMRAAASKLGLTLQQHQADSDDEIEAVFSRMVQSRVEALFINTGPFFTSRSRSLAEQAMRHAMPAVYQGRDFASAGGLMSYGVGSPASQYHVVGVYTGRILKGAPPADLPVQRATKLDLIINLKTAKALGLTIPETLLATADEVIQ
jgi:putative ABC transport system substrate-binding protein